MIAHINNTVNPTYDVNVLPVYSTIPRASSYGDTESECASFFRPLLFGFQTDAVRNCTVFDCIAFFDVFICCDANYVGLTRISKHNQQSQRQESFIIAPQTIHHSDSIDFYLLRELSRCSGGSLCVRVFEVILVSYPMLTICSTYTPCALK